MIEREIIASGDMKRCIDSSKTFSIVSRLSVSFSVPLSVRQHQSSVPILLVLLYLLYLDSLFYLSPHSISLSSHSLCLFFSLAYPPFSITLFLPFLSSLALYPRLLSFFPLCVIFSSSPLVFTLLPFPLFLYGNTLFSIHFEGLFKLPCVFLCHFFFIPMDSESFLVM